MPKLLKIILAVAAVPAGLFLFGFFGVIFGVYTPEPSDITQDRPPISVKSEHVVPEPRATPPLPHIMTADAVADYLSAQWFLRTDDGAVTASPELFSGLSLEDASALYEALRDQPSERDFSGLRTLFFAGCSYMPKDRRRDFFEAVHGLYVERPLHGPSQGGDYLRLFQWDETGLDPLAEQAIRNYAAILKDGEMIYALDHMGAITRPTGRYSPGARSTRWKVQADERLATLDGPTLQAIHDAVGIRLGGDRPILRKQIRNLIDKKAKPDPL